MCVSPITTQEGNTFSCGKCKQCHNKYIQHWTFRLQQEQKRFNYSLFITLTYDYNSIPFNRGKWTLRKEDYQLFLKRLRKKLKRELKYVICGEYGSKNGRPHYHILLFNVSNDDFNDIQEAWGLGTIHVGNVQPASIAYVFKYSVKADIKPLDWRQAKPFVSMSKGLGEQFAFDLTYKKVSGLDKNNKAFTRTVKIRTPKAHFKEKLDTLTVLPYYVIPSTKGGTVKMSVPRFYLKAANYDTSELTAIYETKIAEKYNHLNELQRRYAINQEAIQRGRAAAESTLRDRIYTVSKEKL